MRHTKPTNKYIQPTIERCTEWLENCKVIQIGFCRTPESNNIVWMGPPYENGRYYVASVYLLFHLLHSIPKRCNTLSTQQDTIILYGKSIEWTRDRERKRKMLALSGPVPSKFVAYSMLLLMSHLFLHFQHTFLQLCYKFAFVCLSTKSFGGKDVPGKNQIKRADCLFSLENMGSTSWQIC